MLRRWKVAARGWRASTDLAINAVEDASERAIEDVLQGIGMAFANSPGV
ncbi:MAG: hypothetical protein OXG82_00265 [Gammaproteobacteria bacterium]|nr:hypothetical protein [Gammaproteobacteria bacterium]